MSVYNSNKVKELLSLIIDTSALYDIKSACDDRLTEISQMDKVKCYLVQYSNMYDTIWLSQEEATAELVRLTNIVAAKSNKVLEYDIKNDEMPKIVIRNYLPEEVKEFQDAWNPSHYK